MRSLDTVRRLLCPLWMFRRFLCSRWTLFAEVDRVDDADDRGIDGTILHAGRHPRGTAADDEHRLADAGIDGVNGDEISTLEAAGIARVDGAGHQQLVADETRILARRDDSSHDPRQKHARDAPPRTWRLTPSRSPCRLAGRLRGSRAGAG